MRSLQVVGCAYNRYTGRMNEKIPTIRELVEHAAALQKRLAAMTEVFDVSTKQSRIDELEAKAREEGFWDDAQSAGAIMQEAEGLKKEIAQFEDVQQQLVDILELLESADDAEYDFYQEECQSLATYVERIEVKMLLSEPYDDHNAILVIYAGAGGTDAQDWTQMLLRMYMRWSQKHDFAVKILDESRGSEAGYKSVMIEVRGKMAYGFLRMEMGTHRLVRLSPFNSDSLRQTSFARVEVLPVLESDADITIDMQDVRIDTYRSQGAGGQSINTTDSAVRITHIPTNIVVTCQNERSQLQNKEHAMKVLRGKLAQKRIEEQEAERARLRGEDVSAQWGSQIRSYVLHPYKMVKDHRTKQETTHVQDILDGDIDAFIDAALRWHSQR